MKRYDESDEYKQRLAKAANLVLVVECVVCGATREIRPGEIAPDDFPLCDNDGMPMTPKEAKHEH